MSSNRSRFAVSIFSKGCINLLQKYVGSIVFSTSLIAASSSDFYVIKAQNIVFHPNANTLCKQETQDCQNPLLIPMFYVAGFWTSLSVQVWANTLSNEALCQNFFYFDEIGIWLKKIETFLLVKIFRPMINSYSVFSLHKRTKFLGYTWKKGSIIG